MTAAEAHPTKPAWTRCPGCRERLFNDRVDIEHHRAVCPGELLRQIKRLTKRLTELEDALADIQSATTAPVSAEPLVDLEGVAPWPGDELAHEANLLPDGTHEPEPADADPFEEPLAVHPSAQVSPAIPGWYEDDDEDDGPSVTISRPVMH